jgi:uncharacterized protein
MNILIFLSHPAQFLFYKNPIVTLRNEGHKVIILIKTKDILSNLLDEAGIGYHNILPRERGKSKLSIFLSLLLRDYKLFNFTRKNSIHLLLGSDASLAHIGWLLKIPCITTLEDDYKIIKNLADLTFPVTSVILTPGSCDVGKWKNKKVAYDGYMKLSYLHPSMFVPDKRKITIDLVRPFYIIRLAGLGAHHDFGIKGISDVMLQEIINILEQKGKVYISSENVLKPRFEKYRLNIALSDIHHYLFFSDMLVCDSQSMAVEAAMLGTPGVRISSFSGSISVLEELENKYNLTFGFKPEMEGAILRKISELLSLDDMKQLFQKRRQKMLSEKINVSSFVSWFISNYPSSLKIMKENPDFQYKFR